MPSIIEEQVLRLQVAVHDARAVHVLEGEQQLAEGHLDRRWLEVAVPLEDVVEVAAGAHLEDEDEVRGRLE